METNKLLLHHRFKNIGWTLFIISIIHYYFSEYHAFRLLTSEMYVPELFNKEPSPYSWGIFSLQIESLNNTILYSLPIISIILLIYSKEKQEDEFTSKLRLSSLMWALLVSLLFTFFSCLFIYGTLFIQIYFHYLYILPILYLIRFQYLLVMNSFYSKSDEK